jgi:hypothetical protein
LAAQVARFLSRVRQVRSSPRADPPFARGWAAWDTGPLASCYRGRDTQDAGRDERRMGGERMSEGSGRAEVERRMIERSIEDEAFRQRLLEDPKGAVEEELGTRLPEEVRVVTVEETQDTIYLVLPGTPIADAEGVELSDQQLESVAGGTTAAPEAGGCTVSGPCQFSLEIVGCW